MRCLRHYCLSVLLLLPLAGCWAVSAWQVAFTVMSLPAPDQEGKVKLEGYSIGPTDEEGFDQLVANAIPPPEGIPEMIGRAQWSGLYNVRQRKHIQSVAAITDQQILFLWWHEVRERYEILIRVPWSEFHSIERDDSGVGTVLRFCLRNSDVPVGDQTIAIQHSTWFNYLKSGAFVDREKTRRAFEILNRHVTPDPGQLPDPCQESPESDPEAAGFGEDDITKQPR